MAYDNNFLGFLDTFKTIIGEVVRSLNKDDECENIMESALSRLLALWRNLGRILTSYPQCEPLVTDLQRMINCVEEMKRYIRYRGYFATSYDNCMRLQNENYGIRLQLTASVGRPRYIISRDQLVFFIENGFSVRQIARLLHVSMSSIRRRLRQRMVQGMLQAEGIVVQRSRVAQSLIRTDEAGVAIRWCRTIKRRTYNVSGPNALWHVDGNHKLIRWNMVIHGGIDGYSRMVVYLNIALNNRANTAFLPFLKACNQFGVPSRVRTDHGLENLEIGTFMLSHRGQNRGSIITGRSVHNQRIERLWRDRIE